MIETVTTRIVECIPVDADRNTVAENIELDIYSSTGGFHFATRSRRRQKSTAAQYLRNKRESIKRLRRIIKTYFRPNDYYITLTYRKNPKNVNTVYSDCEAFTGRLVRKCRRIGIEVFWLYIVERGEEHGRYHVHLLLNQEVPKDLLYELWERVHGDVWFGQVPTTAKGTHRLASYCRKADTYETHKRGQHAWRSSKNMKDPKMETDDKLISPSEFVGMINGDGSVDEGKVVEMVNRKFPGYMVVHVKAVINPYTEIPYLSIMLQKSVSSKTSCRLDDV